MDNRFGDIEIFLTVAAQGSFAEAARMMRLTPSAVSRSVARLEKRLSVTLLRRTTRALALTTEGLSYRDRMSALIADMAEIEGSLNQANEVARGLLRVNASPSFGVQCLIPALPGFAERHPAVKVELTLTDSIVDLVEKRADIAIRIGPLRDTLLRAKKLGHSRMTLVASPDYLARRGTPRKPDDLDAHDCLRFSFRRSFDSWPFQVGKRVVQKPVEARFSAIRVRWCGKWPWRAAASPGMERSTSRRTSKPGGWSRCWTTSIRAMARTSTPSTRPKTALPRAYEHFSIIWIQ